MLPILRSSFIDDLTAQVDSMTHKFLLNQRAFRPKMKSILAVVFTTRRRGNQLTALKHTAGSRTAKMVVLRAQIILAGEKLNCNFLHYTDLHKVYFIFGCYY